MTTVSHLLRLCGMDAGPRSARGGTRGRANQPRLEALEDRTAPAGLSLGLSASLGPLSLTFGVRLGDSNEQPPPPPATGSISGTVFDDLDYDSVRDAGEEGLAGVTVYIDLNQDGVFGSGDMSATTDANGQYTFSGLEAGTNKSYTVGQLPREGWVSTTDPVTVSLTSAGQQVNGVDFGQAQDVAQPN